MTTATATRPTYRCAICGKRLGDVWVYSHFTGARYCSDVDACKARAKRRARA
jgi:hypothetical protein